MAIVVLVLWAVTAGAGCYLLLTGLGPARRPRPATAAAGPAAAGPAAAGPAAAVAAAAGPRAGAGPAPAAGAAAGASPRQMRRAAKARFDTPSLVASRNAPMLPGARSLLEFAHPAVAVVGLGFWFGYTFVHPKVLAWIAFGLAAAAACLGLAWLAASARAARRGGRRRPPLPAGRLIAVHGAAAAVTVTLAALTAFAARGW
jgi:hypothetical protein